MKNQSDLVIDKWGCSHNFIKFVHCPHPVLYAPDHFWTRYPLPATRMWNLMSIFDIPSYICFFTSLTLTVVFMKFYTYLGSKMGLETMTEEFILIPIRYLTSFEKPGASTCKLVNFVHRSCLSCSPSTVVHVVYQL